MAPPTAIDLPGGMDTQTPTVMDRLSVNGVPSRRAKAPKMSAGVAAHTSSDIFKSPGYGKPKAKRWDHKLTEESKARKTSSLKGLAAYLKQPGIISLGGGLPSSQYFPFEYIDVKVPQAPRFSETETSDHGLVKRVGKYDIAEGKGIYDLHVALNYGQATGSAQLLRFLTEHTEIVHNPPYRDWHCAMSVGSTSALESAYRMFVNRGEYILTEEYTFASAVETGRPLGARWVGVAMDKEGLLPDSLDSVLNNWDPSVRHGAPKPWLLYTVPTGQNPTGATQSLERRKEIYRVAQKHDLYIIEDEPYFFLQMQPYTGSSAPDVPPPATHDAFISALVPSFLSLDTDGRVMRLDSFSKVIAPGTRVGWITASEQIVERFVRAQEISVQNPSGPSQLILFKLLEEAWGHAGYLDWLIYIRLEYTRRRDNMLHACEKYLPPEVASWDPPMAGMFHWIKIDWTKHSKYGHASVLEVEDEIFQRVVREGALVAKGSLFRAQNDDPGTDLFLRTTFAAAEEENVQEAIRRMGVALRDSFGLEPHTNGTVEYKEKIGLCRRSGKE